MTTQDQNTQDMIMAELVAERDKLRAENSKLKGDKGVGSVRVTAKGGIAVYGLGRFPVTLYKSQWVKLLGMHDLINTFIEVNADKLTEKPITAKATTTPETTLEDTVDSIIADQVELDAA